MTYKAIHRSCPAGSEPAKGSLVTPMPRRPARRNDAQSARGATGSDDLIGVAPTRSPAEDEAKRLVAPIAWSRVSPAAKQPSVQMAYNELHRQSEHRLATNAHSLGFDSKSRNRRSAAHDGGVGVTLGGERIAVAPARSAAEEEADRLAVRAVRHADAVRIAPTQDTDRITRKCTKCEEDEADASRLQRSPDGGATAGTSLTLPRALLRSEMAGGTPLQAPFVHQMEASFGARLDSIRVHRDSQAARMSSAIQADAFNFKNHIFFARQKYDTTTVSGQELIAHEVVHCLQNDGIRPAIHRRPATQEKSTAARSQSRACNDGLDWDGRPALQAENVVPGRFYQVTPESPRTLAGLGQKVKPAVRDRGWHWELIRDSRWNHSRYAVGDTLDLRPIYGTRAERVHPNAERTKGSCYPLLWIPRRLGDEPIPALRGSTGVSLVDPAFVIKAEPGVAKRPCEYLCPSPQKILEAVALATNNVRRAADLLQLARQDGSIGTREATRSAQVQHARAAFEVRFGRLDEETRSTQFGDPKPRRSSLKNEVYTNLRRIEKQLHMTRPVVAGVPTKGWKKYLDPLPVRCQTSDCTFPTCEGALGFVGEQRIGEQPADASFIGVCEPDEKPEGLSWLLIHEVAHTVTAPTIDIYPSRLMNRLPRLRGPEAENLALYNPSSYTSFVFHSLDGSLPRMDKTRSISTDFEENILDALALINQGLKGAGEATQPDAHGDGPRIDRLLCEHFKLTCGRAPEEMNAYVKAALPVVRWTELLRDATTEGNATITGAGANSASVAFGAGAPVTVQFTSKSPEHIARQILMAITDKDIPTLRFAKYIAAHWQLFRTEISGRFQ